MTDARLPRPDETPTEEARPAPHPIANDRFKRRWETWFWISTTAAIAVHFAVFALWPEMAVVLDEPTERRASIAINIMAPVTVPEAPAEVRRPQIPVIGTPRVSFDASIDVTPIEPDVFGDPIGPPPTTAVPADRAGARFTPYEVGPVLRNESDVVRALEREYPPLLKESEIGGVVTVWAYVGIQGEVLEAEVRESSGYDSMDAAALRVAVRMQFSPALNRDKAVAVWVSFPITFRVGREAARSPGGGAG